jgi:hypothetical protein
MPTRPKNPLGGVCNFVIGVCRHEPDAARAQSHDLYPALQRMFLFSSIEICNPVKLGSQGNFSIRADKSALLPKH